MNAILLTALTLGGVNGTANTAINHVAPAGQIAADDCWDCDHGGHGGRFGGHCRGHELHGHCMGPMPQTCYDPAYGCYPGTRHMNRYPAFHGTYYRRPYNYRNVFDYPWHADLHEPTSIFSYHVSGEAGSAQSVRPQPMPEPPQPIPAPAAAVPLHTQIERATAGAPPARSPKGLPALRR